MKDMGVENDVKDAWWEKEAYWKKFADGDNGLDDEQ